MYSIKKYLSPVIILANLITTNLVYAAYPSQCRTGQDSGKQSGCTHENDREILEKQCTIQYASSSCESMATYLNAMAVECAKENPPGIDCSMISQNGIYGREAAKFATYIDELEQEDDENETPPGAPGINAPCSMVVGWSKSNFSCLNLPQSSGITEIILNIFYWLLYILGIAGVLGFAVAGLMYIAARDNDTAATKAKKAMTYSAYGIVVGLAGVVIITAIFRLLSGDIEF